MGCPAQVIDHSKWKARPGIQASGLGGTGVRFCLRHPYHAQKDSVRRAVIQTLFLALPAARKLTGQVHPFDRNSWAPCSQPQYIALISKTWAAAAPDYQQPLLHSGTRQVDTSPAEWYPPQSSRLCIWKTMRAWMGGPWRTSLSVHL